MTELAVELVIVIAVLGLLVGLPSVIVGLVTAFPVAITLIIGYLTLVVIANLWDYSN